MLKVARFLNNLVRLEETNFNYECTFFWAVLFNVALYFVAIGIIIGLAGGFLYGTYSAIQVIFPNLAPMTELATHVKESDIFTKAPFFLFFALVYGVALLWIITVSLDVCLKKFCKPLSHMQ